MPETPENPLPRTAEKMSLEDVREMNSKFSKLHDKRIIREALEAFDSYCEKLDKDELQNQLRSALNQIKSSSMGIDRATGSEQQEVVASRVTLARQKFEIAKNIFISKYFQAARGGLASSDSLRQDIENAMHGRNFDDVMQASQDRLPQELKLQIAGLRAADEAELDMQGKSIDSLYRQFDEMAAKHYPERQLNIIMDTLAAKEGFDRLSSAQLQEKLPQLNVLQQKVVQYVTGTLRDQSRNW